MIESAWQRRVFRTFYFSQTLSFAGDGLRAVLIPLIVFSLTHSAFSVGITYAVQTVPTVITSIFSGYLADHLDRKRLMIAADCGRFLTLAGLAYLATVHALTVGWIYAGVLVISVLSALFLSCTAPTLANILDEKELTSGVSSLQSAEAGTRIVTNAAAGAALQSLGMVWSLALNAVAYFVSLAYLLRVPSFGQRAPTGDTAEVSVVKRILAGFSFVFAHPTLRLFALVSIGLNATNMMESVITIPWLKTGYGISDAQVGYFYTVLSLGAVAGFWLASHLPKVPFGRMYALLLIVHGLCFVPVVLVHNIWVTLVFWTAVDLTAAAAGSLMISWRIRVTPKDRVGRMMSALRVLVLVGTVPSALLAGDLAVHNIVLVLAIIAAGYLLLGALAAGVPQMRDEAS